jgi:hypothetical protein
MIEGRLGDSEKDFSSWAIVFPILEALINSLETGRCLIELKISSKRSKPPEEESKNT